MGERRFVLESLLGQDVDGTFEWLAGEARRWASLHERWVPVTGDIARLWRKRAEAAEALLLSCLPAEEEVVAHAAGN
ncbi:MAG TPA: hypothetical protein VFF07_02660 [Actinomycetota bacterium]|nr:hypothetical protein [Actinomycetota bacterium]